MSVTVSFRCADGTVRMLAISAAPDATVADVAAYLVAADPTSNAEPAQQPHSALMVTPLSSGPSPAPYLVAPDMDWSLSGIRSGDHVEIADAAQSALSDVPRAVATVRVVEGADVGATFVLAPGVHVVGRDADASVQLSDPLASQRHARIVVGDTIEVIDLGSTNGVLVGDAYVTRATLVSGDRVVIGTTVLDISMDETAQAVAPDRLTDRHVPPTPATQTIPYIRPPRVVPALDSEELTLPDPPAKPQPRSFPRAALLGPVALGLTMFAVTGRALSLVFVAMSPLMMIGSALDNRFTQRKQSREALREFANAVESTRASLEQAHARERQVRLLRSPSVAQVCEAVMAVSSPLWTHRPEHDQFLEVRLGLGTVRSALAVAVPQRREALDGTWEQVEALAQRYASIDAVPVTASLRDVGGVGIVGDAAVAHGVARAAVTHVAGLHSPTECIVTGFVPAHATASWRWLEWLPHTSSPLSPVAGDHVASTQASAQRLLGALEAVIAGRTGIDIGAWVPRSRPAHTREGPNTHHAPNTHQAQPPTTPAVLVVVDGAFAADRARLIRIAEKGPDVNVHVLWIAESMAALPGACRSFIQVSSAADAVVGHVRRGGFDRAVAVETLTVVEAEAVARRLACIEDVGAVVDDDADIPRAVPYLSLHGFEALDAEHYVGQWQRERIPDPDSLRPFSLRALVGHTGQEPFYLDIATEGPHALVGGTTGAGKSELLQAWVLGLAAAYSPQRVTFLFVDYKGGSAFADCVNLPHSVGLVTDLTPHLVERALTSLRAELHYRERLLAAKGAKDLETLYRAGDSEAPPSLVIVVDEFATLARDVPEFVDGVVDIAQRGRSLGLHLILATQRPTGVIKDNLRANTNLRIALRMADEADSTDILGIPTAAHVDPALPGRALARTGPGRVAAFQCAYAGSYSVPGHASCEVAVRERALGAGAQWTTREGTRTGASIGVRPGAPDGESDVARVVAALRLGATRLNMAAPRRPWLDELAACYRLDDLAPTVPDAVAFAVGDDPQHQSQFTVTFEPDHDGNMLILGGSGAGKSTAVRSIALGATLSTSLAPVHIYAIDAASAGLDILRPLPHVADVIEADDHERVARMMSRLVAMVRERSAVFTASRASTLTHFRTLSAQPPLPRVLVLIDGYGSFQADYMNDVARHHVFATFREILAAGRAVGVHVVLSADRIGALHTSIQALIPRTVTLRQNDDAAYSMLGLRKVGLTSQSPAGRGIDLATRKELHVAVLGGSPRIDDQAHAIEALAATLGESEQWRAEPIPRMPTLVTPRDVPDAVAGLPTLGIDSATLKPRGFDLERPIMIAGQAGTGRTGALAWLATAIRRAYPHRRIVHLTQRRTRLAGLSVWTASYTSVADVDRFVDTWAADLESPVHGDDGIVVCIENVQDVGASMNDAALVHLLKQARRAGHLLIGEADCQGWMSGPLVSEIKGSRRGLLLAPESADAQVLFSVPAPRVARTDMPPGRGIWVESGRVTTVQIPWVDNTNSTDQPRTALAASTSRYVA